MKIHRFFINEQMSENSTFRSEDSDLIHQLRDVFRMKKGDVVALFNGSGYEYEADIELLTKKEVVFLVKEEKEKVEKGAVNAHIFISIIKKDKLELALEKATELGVGKITPIIAERSQYKKVRHDRLHKVVREAAEQCGRVTLPELTPELTLEQALDQYPNMTVLDMDGEEGAVETNYILVGPEGGWSEKERGLFKEKNVSVRSLPFNTLRAETAVMAVLARV